MILNEYCQLTFSNPNATRVVIYPNDTIAASLLNHHKTNEIAVITLSECISDGAVSLPMPNEVLSTLDKKVTAQSGRSVVVGIDGYLSLLSSSNVEAFFVALRGRVDDGALNAVFLISDEYFCEALFSLQYSESRRILKISGDFEMKESLKVTVIPDKWATSDSITNYKSLFERFGNFSPSGSYTLALKGITAAQAGFSNQVSFLFDVKQIAEKFYSTSSDLPVATLESLLAKANERVLTPESYLEAEFGRENINTQIALKQLLELPNDEIWVAYVWLMLKRLPKSYLSATLGLGVTHDNLLRKYVVDAAITLLGEPDAKTFANERATALAGLEVESFITEFIGQTKENDMSIPFLNCQTTAERIEIIRRSSKLDIVSDLPDSFKLLYPTLADYLSIEFDYGDETLTAYFKEYRRRKLNNAISESFVKKAYDTTSSTTIYKRDALLSDLNESDGVALLVVDGMGAEYLPLLLAMAKRRNMNIESFTIASVNLPSSTKFNSITWTSERVLEEVRDVDNFAHNGASKHETCTPERNLDAVLRTFETKVFTRIADGLSRFSRVVVTSDHGASRLAVLAHNAGLGATLPWEGQPDDWRYSIAPHDTNRPDELEAQYQPKYDKTYWIVRGYNRLPKQGGKTNELHGGASLEERLVPIVVFTKSESVVKPKRIEKKATEQLVDKIGFDI